MIAGCVALSNSDLVVANAPPLHSHPCLCPVIPSLASHAALVWQALGLRSGSESPYTSCATTKPVCASSMDGYSRHAMSETASLPSNHICRLIHLFVLLSYIATLLHHSLLACGPGRSSWYSRSVRSPAILNLEPTQ